MVPRSSKWHAKAGADELINYQDEDVRERLKTLTKGQGVDVVIDPVGGDLFETVFRSIAWNGRYVGDWFC